MDSKINLSQLSDLFAQASGMSRTASEQFVKTFFEIIADKVLSEGLVKIKGFGTFKLLQMEDRESVNVNTGERFTIDGHQKISFTPDAELKESINRPFASFETVELTEEQEKVLTDMETETAKEPDDVSEQQTESCQNEPFVQDVTPGRSKRIFLTVLLWIAAVILVLGLVAYLLWPIIGSRMVEYLDRDRESAAISVEPVSRESVPAAQIQPEQIVKAGDNASAASVQQTVPASQTESAPVAPVTGDIAEKKVEKSAAASVSGVFKMDEEDSLRDLSSFTAADTVKYGMAGRMATHVMQNGETLTKISLKYYGTKKMWPYIAAFNGISDFGSLKPGTSIGIPKLVNRNR